jgi:hypothetical protein
MRILDNVVNVAPVVKEVTRKDGTKALVAVVTVAGREAYAWASRPKLIRGTWVIPSYTLKMKLDGAMDSDFQEYTAKDGHKYTAAKIEGDIPKGIQIVGWRSKFDPTVVIMELTVWADYFQK